MGHLAEDGVLIVEVGERSEADEELRARAVGVRAARLARARARVTARAGVRARVRVEARVGVGVRVRLGSKLRAIESTPKSCLRSLNSALIW